MKYAFLVLKEHPYGREMLSQLLAAGFEPALVIEEDSPVADEERAKFLERLAGQPLPPTFDELLAARSVRRESVPHHNQGACEALLRELGPDLMVLGGTRILKPNIFRLAPAGALNSHPGLLPEVRGSASVAWSIYHDVPIGCTCHFIEEGIDVGPIVGRRLIPVHRGQTYEELVHATNVLAGTLMVEAVRAHVAGTLRGTPQPAEGTTYRVIPPELLAVVKEKLARGTYEHFVDEPTVRAT
jgi:methionyl-tRNA formyltransferase